MSKRASIASTGINAAQRIQRAGLICVDRVATPFRGAALRSTRRKSWLLASFAGLCLR